MARLSIRGDEESILLPVFPQTNYGDLKKQTPDSLILPARPCAVESLK